MDHQLHITSNNCLLLFCCFFSASKAELLQESIFFLIHLFARAVLVKKKLEMEKTKPTFIVSVLKVEYLFLRFPTFSLLKQLVQIFR